MQHAWAANFISQWCLSRLIRPSVEYGRIMNLDFKGACSLWLGCNATRCLLDLSGLCFSRFDEAETKIYILDLENIFADSRPHFDWCIAHLSSLFPLKFISNILRMPSMLSPNFISSTVTVLEYLSSSNERSLGILLKEIVNEALLGTQPNLQTKDYIPNLFQLASKSEIYAQSILNVLLEFVNSEYETFLERLKRQLFLWPSEYNPVTLHSLLPELVLKTKYNGTKLLLMIASNFYENSWCRILLEIILVELEALVFNDKACPLFNDIRKDCSWGALWDACISDNKLLQQTAIRLILVSTSERTPLLYCKTIEHLMTSNSLSNPSAFNALVRLMDDPSGVNDIPDIKVAVSHIIQKLSIDISNKVQHNQCYYVMRNLANLVTLEKGGHCPFLKRGSITSALQSSIGMLIHIWEDLLRKVMVYVESTVIKSNENGSAIKRIKLESLEDPMEIAELYEEKSYHTKDHLHMLTKLLDLLNISTLNISDGIKLEKLTVKYFFWCLTESDLVQRTSAVERCNSLLNKQCVGNNKKGIRSAALRDLLEGALFLYGNLFGEPRHVAEYSQIYHKKDESLLKLNQRQGISLNVSRSSILHSGVIGCGVPKVSQPWIPDGLDNEIKNIYLKVIVACCQDDQNEKQTIEGFCQVAQLLVELVSSDVMYNGLAWPEEEFTKITIERDLHIRKTFKNCPILWSILGLLASKKPALSNCSVFLRAICASVMHHWRAKSTETINGNNSELMFFTTKLLEILALGQLLPPPLSYLYIVVEYLETNEIAYVLKECVWNYFVIHGPSMQPINSESSELNNQRLFINESPRGPADQFIDPLRNTMQKKNLSTLGNLFYQMFILPTCQP